MSDLLCSKCRRHAIIFQRYSGLHLCKTHFIADFEAKAKRAVRSHRWIRSGDRIGVAVSGGKDSSALLYFLTKLLKKRRDISLYAITIDEGIRGYRDCSIASQIAERLNIDHITASFEEEFGITLNKIVQERGDRLSCSFCGVLRRQLLNRVARRNGATRLALGFNLDDEAQSVLMNVLRGDTDRLLRQMGPAEGLVPRIKPFLYIPEREVALYALIHVEGFEIGRCPYSHNALRADVRNLLNDYSWRHPATRYSLVNLGEHLAATGTAAGSAVTLCKTCGEPSIGECQPCRMLSEVLHDRC